MTVSSQALTGTERARFKRILREARGRRRELLDKRMGKLIREAIEESGSSTLRGAIAAKIRDKFLS